MYRRKRSKLVQISLLKVRTTDQHKREKKRRGSDSLSRFFFLVLDFNFILLLQQSEKEYW